MTTALAPRSVAFGLIILAVAGEMTVSPSTHSPVTAVRAEVVAAADTISAGDFPNVELESADGAKLPWGATNGHVRIATLFYGHCPGVCPMTVNALRGIEGSLTASERAQLRVILVSLDPTRDSPQALRAFAREHDIASPRWLIARTSPMQTQALARAAHIEYRPLSDGSLDHASALVLLDARGRVLTRMRDNEDLAEFVAATRGALDRAGGN